jgi:hypothetical protein
MHARHTPGLALALLLTLTFGIAFASATGMGCADPKGGGPVEPYPAPDFSLPDFNPYSDTWNDFRSPSAEVGKVLVLFFASFS